MVEQKSVFNAQVLIETAENDSEWAKELLIMFKKDIAERTEAVKSTLSDSIPDAEKIRIHFHTIKSSAGSVGASALKDLAFEFEKASKEKDLEFIKKNMEKFEELARKSVEEFEKTIKSLF